MIYVKDTGFGISFEDQKKIFSNFVKISDTKHLNPNGVGLGLSISKKIANLLNGDIKVNS